MNTLPPAIMVQGTSSNAGKSLLATALCRIFSRRGLRVFPFKAQNMTSYFSRLPGGLCMSGAQVLQALAAGQAPQARMNPILLRPCGGMGSEVMVLGQSRGVMPFSAYTAQKEQLFEAVAAAYSGLAAGADVMIIEGAGSPAEINLQAHDIVNMRMARFANAAVLLAGDIDRGGVFAHLYGTWLLLPESDRERIAGFVLNKFRGDASLLAPAMQEITAKTGVPFMAVVPALPLHGLPEEDSLSLAENPQGAVMPVNIAGEGIVAALAAQHHLALELLADAVEAAFLPGQLEGLLGKC